jgi:hypothetical protein
VALNEAKGPASLIAGVCFSRKSGAQLKSGQRRFDAWHDERTLTDLQLRRRTANG